MACIGTDSEHNVNQWETTHAICYLNLSSNSRTYYVTFFFFECSKKIILVAQGIAPNIGCCKVSLLLLAYTVQPLTEDTPKVRTKSRQSGWSGHGWTIICDIYGCVVIANFFLQYRCHLATRIQLTITQ